MSSFTSGIPSRETCVQAPPSMEAPVGLLDGLTLATLLSLCGTGLRTADWRRLAVVQAPITGSLPAVRQAAGTSSAIEVTL